MGAGSNRGGRLYFFWDYDIDEQELREILRHGDADERAWAITRILEYAKWEDIWRFLDVDMIRENFERLRFRRPQDREVWAYALGRWRGDG
jgi:hypothetical protein